MCYRCQICQEVSQPGEPLKLHPIHRRVPQKEVKHQRIDMNGIMRTIIVQVPERMEIAKETPCCKPCYDLLQFAPLSIVMRQRGKVLTTGKVVQVVVGGTQRTQSSKPNKGRSNSTPAPVQAPYKPTALTPAQLIQRFMEKGRSQGLTSRNAYKSTPTPPPVSQVSAVCDHCGGKVGKDAQHTAHSVICKNCINNSKRKGGK